MKYLLDTHVMLWLLLDSDKLSKKARKAIISADSVLYWSAASQWELSVKASLGKLELADNWQVGLARELKRNRILHLPITHEHCSPQQDLPWHHRDPFDRLIICQAMSEGLAIITRDRQIKQYRVKTLW